MDMIRGKGYYHLVIFMVIYYFFNGFLLPEGLLYTAILSPVMLYVLYKYRDIAPTPAWIVLLLVPVPFQVLHGVDFHSYLVSGLLVLSVFIFYLTSVVLLRKYEREVPGLFRTILAINGIFTFLALLALPFAPARDLVWYSVPVSAGIDLLPRLKLFTYEASYYSLIMMPVFLYFIFRVMSGKEKHTLIIAMACIIPLLLSLSFGVIGASLIALFITLLFYWRYLPLLFRRISVYSLVIALFTLALIAVTWAGNPVFMRMENILQGKDTSAMGRLVYSFIFAKDLAFVHNWIFGVGPGQIKILAHDMIVNHYQYHGSVAEIVRIPNAIAETLATYGVYGLVVKLFLEVYFFFRKKIYGNIYAFSLFVFLFIYQFTGSFLVNAAELGAWALVFSTRFSEFELLPGNHGKELRS